MCFGRTSWDKSTLVGWHTMALFRWRIRLECLTPIEYGHITIDIIYLGMFVSRNCTNVSMRIGLAYDCIYIITIIITIYVQLKRSIYHVQTYQVLYSSWYYLPRVPPCHTAQSLNYWDSKCLSSHFLLKPHREKRGCSAKWCIAPEILFFSNWAQIRYSNPKF